jgi:hypothetical protein
MTPEYRYTIGNWLFVYDGRYLYYYLTNKTEGKEISSNDIVDKEGLIKMVWQKWQ